MGVIVSELLGMPESKTFRVTARTGVLMLYGNDGNTNTDITGLIEL
jgi:hypothetical protein